MRPLFELAGISEEELATRRIRCDGVALDITSGDEFLAVEYQCDCPETADQEYWEAEPEADKMAQDFCLRHPHFAYALPYTGASSGPLYLFSGMPEMTRFDQDSIELLHRGGVGIVRDCPKNALILMDLD